ncbi:hypothetical protein AG0111_0g8704 [Alternaria gaisen]|uniref:Uncharacterized protein n=1 Tax=Alternaria gaisen TaxID=167740 RepID=A0ACB6FDZ6_9PLEO|nr:hypothetical protein AG0111_0g8704 [Alternaria gaisen]
MSVTETVTVPPSTTRETQNGSDSTIILNSLDGRIRVGSRDVPSSQSENNAQANDVWDSSEGWPVVGAGAAIFFVYLGLVYSYGIVQLQLERRQLANVPTLSFIGSVAAAISPLTGAFVARIIKRIGYRATAATGSFLLGLGEFCAGFSTHSVPAMFVTQGFLFGIGAALLFLPAASLPSLWFKRKRGLATGLVYGGAGVGSAVIALSLEKLIDTTSLETALKVLGACACIICLPATYFLKPPRGSRRAVSKMQWRLMQSPKFILMLLMGAVATFPLFVPPFLLPLYAASLGLSGQTGAAILAAWNFASAVGRIVMGFGADKVLGPVNSMILSLLLVSLSALALWPFASNLGLIIFFAIVNGVGSGGFFSLMPVVVGAVFGDDITTVMSMLNTSWFFGYFMGAPIAGYLLDAYGGTGAGLAAYRPAIFYAGSLTLASAGLLLSVRLMITQKLSAKV